MLSPNVSQSLRQLCTEQRPNSRLQMTKQLWGDLTGYITKSEALNGGSGRHPSRLSGLDGRPIEFVVVRCG